MASFKVLYLLWNFLLISAVSSNTCRNDVTEYYTCQKSRAVSYQTSRTSSCRRRWWRRRCSSTSYGIGYQSQSYYETCTRVKHIYGCCPGWSGTSCSTQCGKPAISPTQRRSRIIGGTEATPHSWPWQIMIVWPQDGKLYFLCGGSIIHGRWIIIAAHCLKYSINPGSYRVIVGKHALNEVADHEKTLQIAELHVHENYKIGVNGVPYEDIALLKLQEQVEFNDQVSPICVTNTPAPDNQDCYATGWGHTENKVISPDATVSMTLQQALLPIINKDQCKTYPKIGAALTDNMLCAGYASGLRGVCPGDSGGPLVCKLPGKEFWTLFGLTSWGGIGGCGTSNSPGVFVEVAQYATWIAEKTGGDVKP